jgi:hypothetical protein
MMKEQIRKSVDSNLRTNMHFNGKERISSLRGEVFWVMQDEKTGEIQDRGHILNVVTIDASILVARLLKSPGVANVSEPKFGIYALAVGTGDVGWDPMNPPSGTSSQRSLYNELGRKSVALSDFIDNLGAISAFPTNVVDYTVTFAAAEAVGPLVEMGLLGGDIDTNMAVTNPILPPNGLYDPTVDVRRFDTLVNYVTFPVINKPPTSSLSWTWRISS